MPRKPIIPIRVDDETKARWQAAAGPNASLAEFIRQAVEEKIEREVTLPPQIPSPRFTPEFSPSNPAIRDESGKRSYAPDPKGGKPK